MFCVKCGKELAEGSNVCSACGYITENITIPVTGNESKETKPKKSKKKKRFIFAAIIAIVIFLFIIAPTSENESTDSGNSTTNVSADATDEAQSDNENLPSNTEDYSMNKTEPEDTNNNKEISKSSKNKIDKAYKKREYEKLAKLYTDGNSAEKTYINSQASVHFAEKIKSYPTIVMSAIEELKTSYNKLTATGVSSEWLTIFNSTLVQLIELYEKRSNLPEAYKGPIPKNCEPTYLDVYVSVRIGDSQNQGQYLDYYGAYVDYKYSYGDYYPDYDSEMIIIKSTEPLAKGIFSVNAVENGTYDTISNGFEETHRLFIVYTDDQWAEYYDSSYYDNERKYINEAISILEEDGLLMLAENKIDAAKTTLNKAIAVSCQTMFIGSWAEAYTECYIQIDPANDGFDVSITLSEPDKEYQTNWEMTCKYDFEKGGLAYEDGVCYVSFYSPSAASRTVYSDGSGLFYIENDILYWDDYEDDRGANCSFTSFVW